VYRHNQHHYSTGADTLSLDWGAFDSDDSSSMFDAGDYGGTLTGDFDSNLSFSSTPAPAPSSSSASSSSSSADTSDILAVVGKGLDVLGQAIPAIAGDAAKDERAEKAKLEAEKLRLEQARLQAMAGLGQFGGAGTWQQQQMRAQLGSGMSTGTKVALGVGAAALLYALWPKRTAS
jgi:hypothetical protein